MKFSKRFFAMVALFTLLIYSFVSFIIPVQEAQAVGPVFLAPEVISVVAGLATAAGLTFIDADSAKAWASKAWTGFSNATKTAINNVVAAGAVAGMFSIYISQAIWNDFYKAEVSDGEVMILESGVKTSFSAGTSADTYLLSPYGYLVINFDNIAQHAANYIRLNNNKGTVAVGLKYKDYIMHYYYRVFDDITGFSTGDVFFKEYYLGSGVYSDPPYVSILCNGSLFEVSVDGELVCSISSSTSFSQVEVRGSSGEFILYPTAIYNLVAGESYTIDDRYYGNPSWDLSNKTIALPESLGDVVGKTASDIANENTLTDGVTAPGSIISVLVGKIGSIVDFLTSTDFSLSLDFSPLITVADLFQDKFPFSIPWDFARSFSLIATESSWTPIFSIDLSDHIPGFAFDIDLHLFDSILPYIRSFEVFLFDLGLVFATSRLLGGDA